jgi:predicted ATPase
MKIRELVLRQFRAFGDTPRVVSFADKSTGLVRPLTVLVGANGSGKSSIFEVIYGLFGYALTTVEDPPITHEIREHGYAAMQVEFSGAPSSLNPSCWIVLGRKDRAAQDFASLGNLMGHLEQRGASGKPYHREGPRAELNRWVDDMTRGVEPLRDGLLHFPHHRWLERRQTGSIEPPPPSRPWLFRFVPTEHWQGSLAQQWVWQNYLDLEAARAGRPNLTPYIDTVQQVLGDDQSIIISHGQVRIRRKRQNDEIELHELPAGQQQVLTLFGELVRRVRPGGVVLIDEVELSLHPALQRVVLFHLRQLAARNDLQIVLSTHSMDVVSAVAPHEVVNLDDMVLEERQHRGASTDVGSP